MGDKILDNETIEATLQKNGYLFIYWKTNTMGHLPKSLIKGLRSAEKLIVKYGLSGWYCNSEEGHKDMHKIIERCGGVRSGEKDGFIWFTNNFKKEKKNV